MDAVPHTNIGIRPSLALASSPTDGPNFLPPSCSESSIIFRHPGYPDRGNIILRLPAMDGGSENNTDPFVHGIHHSTALWACTIIACGLEGMLSPSRIPSPPAPASITTLGPDHLLTSPVYYFYPSMWIDGNQHDLQYPVCPSFRDWVFPVGRVPDEWIQVYESDPHTFIPTPSQYSAAINMRDRTCRLTRFTDSTEVAHLVPQKEDTWFLRNEMSVYNKNVALPTYLITCDIQNLLLLRSDIHTQFDAGAFIIVPKCGTSRIHFIRLTSNYGPLLHNRETEPMNVSPEFLFARFAWAILPLAQPFANRQGVKVRVWSEQQSDWVERIQSGVDSQEHPTKRTKLGPMVSMSVGSSKQAETSQVCQAVDRVVREGKLHHNTPPATQDSIPIPSHSPSPVPWTPPKAKYTHRERIFGTLVAKYPTAYYNRLQWHPDLDRLQEMKEQYLSANEPLHEQEAKRQQELMEGGIILYEGEPVWARTREDGLPE